MDQATGETPHVLQTVCLGSRSVPGRSQCVYFVPSEGARRSNHFRDETAMQRPHKGQPLRVPRSASLPVSERGTQT